MAENSAKELLEKYLGKGVEDFRLLPQSGSARKNFIATAYGQQYIITSNENIAENAAFLYFSEVFSMLKLNTPHIFAVSEDQKVYVQEFVGAETLSEILVQEKSVPRVKTLVKKVLRLLYELQKSTAGKVDYAQTFEYQEYNRLPIWNDLFYFKNMFADVLEVPYQKANLLLEFERLTKIIQHLGPKTLMIRDFQARNIMLNAQDEVFFIDYQSAMKGPALYDVVSFLFQAKANFDEDFKEEMLQYYFQLWKDEAEITLLKESLKPLQLIRYLQVLGAYGFRGLIQKKSHFLNSIDKGVQNLFQFSENWQEINAFPELKNLIIALNSVAVKKKIAAFKQQQTET